MNGEGEARKGEGAAGDENAGQGKGECLRHQFMVAHDVVDLRVKRHVRGCIGNAAGLKGRRLLRLQFELLLQLAQCSEVLVQAGAVTGAELSFKPLAVFADH